MRLYNDDCLNVFRTIADESIDLVVTDCPYHIESGGMTNKNNKTGGMLAKQQNTKNGKLFDKNEIEFADWLPEIFRILKNETHAYIMINPRNLKDLWQAAEDVGFVFQQLLVWDKGNQTPNKFYMNSYELILMLRKGRAKYINDMGTKNILRIPNIMRTKMHPTEKPEELMQILIANSSNESDLVLDPFMGVGGCGLACKTLHRDFIGIEIDEKYFAIAQERIESEDKQLTFF